MMHSNCDLPRALRSACCAILLMAGVGAQETDLRFAHLFGDHMVVQCDAPLRVWGQARPGAEVTLVITEDVEKARRLMGERGSKASPPRAEEYNRRRSPGCRNAMTRSRLDRTTVA